MCDDFKMSYDSDEDDFIFEIDLKDEDSIDIDYSNAEDVEALGTDDVSYGEI